MREVLVSCSMAGGKLLSIGGSCSAFGLFFPVGEAQKCLTFWY